MFVSHLLLLLKRVYAQVWNCGALPRVRSQGFLDNKPNPRAAELSGGGQRSSVETGRAGGTEADSSAREV